MKENKKGNLRVSRPELNRLQIEDSTFSSVILKHFVKPPTSNSSLELSCLINCKSSSVDIFDTPGNRIFTASVVNFIAILDFALILPMGSWEYGEGLRGIFSPVPLAVILGGKRCASYGVFCLWWLFIARVP